MGNSTFINLSSLLELSAKLHESGDKSSILNISLLSLMGKLLITSGVILSNESGRLVPIIQKGQTALDFYKLMNKFNPDKYGSIIDSTELDSIKYIIPIRKQEKLYALICLSNPLIPHELSEDEKKYIELLSSITANAINNSFMLESYKREKSVAERRSQLLSALYEVSRDFGSLLSHDEIIKTLSLTVMGQLTVSKFAVFIENDKKQFHKIIDRIGLEVSESLLRELLVCETATPIEKSDLTHEAYQFCVKKQIAVISPMKVQGNKIGVLLIGNRMNEQPFNSDNLIFIEAIGNTAMAALENERLFTEEIEKKRLESEISIALEIQKNLLPKSPPVTKNFDIFGFSLPTYQVGGDYFDYIKIDENRLLLAIADVSGKGIPASLIMANTQAALRVLAHNQIAPVSIANQINSLLYENTSPDKFVTCFFGVLDQTNNQFTYLNAGHNPPYLFKSDNTMHELHEGGLILGFMDHDFGYNTGNIVLERGDLIIMFTDGVTESHNEKKEEYGEERLINLIKEVKHLNSFDIAQAISADVKKFAGKSPQFDDITTIVLKCIG